MLIFLSPASTVPFERDDIEVVVDTNNVFIFLLTTRMLGDWVVSLNGVSHTEVFQVEATARSFLNFKFQILRKDERGILVPISGLPIAGKLRFTAKLTFVLPSLFLFLFSFFFFWKHVLPRDKGGGWLQPTCELDN